MCRGLLFVVLLVGMGCDDGHTVRVRVCGDLVIGPRRTSSVVVDGAITEVGLRDAGAMAEDAEMQRPAQLDALRIVARDRDFAELRALVTELDSGSPGTRRGFDIFVDFPAPERTEWLQVQGLLGSVPVHWASRGVEEPLELDDLDMPMTRDCYGIECAFGQTCIDGRCRLVPDAETGSRCGE